MSDLFCPTCNRFMMYPDSHKCNPQWEVCFGENVDEAINYGITTVYACDVTDAVEEAAEYDDSHSGEYSIVRNGISKAWARELGTEQWAALIVEAESVPQYSAREV